MSLVALLLLLGWATILLLALLWTMSRLLRPDHPPSGVDPILGARDRVAVYRPSAPSIQPHPSVLVRMPDDLRTNEEMVAWMTQEMPKVVGKAAGAPGP
jgi:hypothetical protein